MGREKSELKSRDKYAELYASLLVAEGVVDYCSETKHPIVTLESEDEPEWDDIVQNFEKMQRRHQVKRQTTDLASATFEKYIQAIVVDAKVHYHFVFPAYIYGFRVVSVFDVSQTEGDELPDIGSYQGEPSEYLESLESFVESKGITLKWEAPEGGALGVSMGGTIMVDPSLESPVRFATLVHEVAHEMLHRSDRREQTDKSLRETEAEAVAFAVCDAVSIESNGHAENYIKLHQGDAEKLRASLDYIREAACEILNALLNSKTEVTGSLVG